MTAVNDAKRKSEESTVVNVEAKRRQWDKLSEKFFLMEGLMEQAYRPLHYHMQLHAAKSVIEVGAGLGTASLEVLKQIPEKATFLCTDLSPKMLSYAREKLQGSRVTCRTANALHLENVKDGSMDRYLANMTLHLCGDPPRMLREARRVLSDDGIAGFTIWGDRQSSSVFSLREEADAKSDGSPISISSFFKLGSDKASLVSMFKAAGFCSVSVFKIDCVQVHFDAESFVQFWNNASSREKSKRDDVWLETLRKGAQALLDQGSPISLESLIIIAKP